MKIVGQQLGQVLLWQPEDEFEEDLYGYRATRSYYDRKAGWLGRAPRIGSAHADYPLAELVRRRAIAHRSGAVVKVMLYYEQLTASAATNNLPPDEYSDNGSTIETDLRQNDYYKDVSDADRATVEEALDNPIAGVTPSFTDPRALRLFKNLRDGFDTFLDGTFQVTKTTYYYKKPSPGMELFGKKEDPGGGYGAAGHWLVITGGTRRRGVFWARDRVYQYSSKVVPDEEYGTEGEA